VYINFLTYKKGNLMKKILIISLVALNGNIALAHTIRRVEPLQVCETAAEEKEKSALEQRLSVINQIDSFMKKLTTKYHDQIGISTASEAVPTNFVAFFENPEFKPESDTPQYLYVYAKQPQKPVRLVRGKPALFREMQDFAKQLETKNLQLGYTCAGGIKLPKDVIFRFDNPDFKPGMPGSGKYCRIFLKS
jgi:hypothetical protein